MKLTPLTLSILTTTLVSGVAIAWAWTGPVGSPFGSNASAPINVGGVDQTKSGGMSSNGFISSGGLRVGLNTMLGSIGSAARSVLEVNGNISTTAGYNGGVNWANIGGTSIAAVSSIYSYGYICANNSNGGCTGTNGIVLGPTANTAAKVNITDNGNSFFNGANLGVGTNNPLAKLHVANAVAGSANIRSSGPTSDNNWAGGLELLSDNGTTVNAKINASTGGLFFNYGGTERMRIASTGSVGIGTTTPSQTLSVNGTIYSSAGGFKFPDGSTQTTAASGQWVTSGTNLYNANTGNVGVGTGASPVSKLDVNGGINIVNNNNLTWGGAYGAGIPTIAGGTGAGLYFYPTGSTSGANVVMSANALSVGTTAADARLRVVGAAGQTAFLASSASNNLYVDFNGGGTNYLRGNTYFNGVLYDENNGAYYVDPASVSILNDVRANIFYDYNNTGYYLDPNGTSRLNSVNTDGILNYGDTTINNAAPTVYFRDTDGKGAVLHNNSNLLYVLTGCGATNSTSWCANGSYWPLQIDLTNDNIQLGGSTTIAEGTLTVNNTIRSTSGGFIFPDGTTQATAATAGQWTTSGTNIYNSNTGNVGLGVTNPIRKLQVNGELSLTRSDNVGFINVSDLSGNGGGSIILRGLGSGGGAEVGATISLVTTAGGTVFGSGVNNYLRGNTYFNGSLIDENNGGYYVNPDGTSIYNDLRANIFYDNQNTGYYVDPNGTSNLNTLRFASSDCIGGTCPPNGAVRMTPNFHLNSGAGYAVILNWDNGTTGGAQTFRIGNGAGTDAYYMTAAGNSTQVGTATINGGIADSAGTRMDSGGGWFRTYGATGWYNGTYGGGWYMTDSTWIRSYGGKNTYMEQGFDTLANSGVGCAGGKGGSYMFQVCGVAGVGAAAYYYTSDARLKDNIKPLQSSLQKVRQLNGYTFNWKEGGRADIGVVAQEVEKVFPDLVKTGADGFKSVEYGNLVAPLIEAIKELANNLDALATRVFNTESRQTELEKQNEIQAQQIRDLQKQVSELVNKK
jgi:hypothetical protein